MAHLNHPRDFVNSMGYSKCSAKVGAASSILEAVTEMRVKLESYPDRQNIEFHPRVTEVYTNSSELFNDEEFYSKAEGATLKSSSESLKYRNEGNKAFALKDFTNSLASFDNGISHAPVNSLEIAFAFANRSAVLLEMGKLEDCISDVHQALDLNYPDKLKYKLFFRKAKCLRDLGHSKQAEEFFNATREALKKAELSDDKKRNTKILITVESKMKAKTIKETHRVFPPPEVPSLSYGPSEEIPCASSALGLRYDDSNGRHFVATRNINIGDVLIVEEPHCLKPCNVSIGDIRRCCSHCQKICFTLLPCPNCTWAMFCSDKCLKEAEEQYHLIECPIITKLRILRPSVIYHHAVVAIRVMLKPLSNAEKKMHNLPSDFSQKFLFFSSKLRSISDIDNFIKNRTSQIKNVNKLTKEVANILNVLHRKNMKLNMEYAILNALLKNLFSSCGTVVTSM